MSYSIFYKSFGIEFPDNQHLIFVECGDSNVFDYSNKRSRSWGLFHSSDSDVFSTPNTLLKWVDDIVNSKLLEGLREDESLESIRKTLGWQCGLKIYGNSKTSYLNILGFLKGATKVRTIKAEDYFKKTGFKLTFKASKWNVKDEQRFDSSKYERTQISTIEEFYSVKKEYDTLVADGILFRYFLEADYYYFESLLRDIKYDNKVKRRESIKNSKNFDKGFYIDFNGNYFAKSTGRHTRYSLYFSGAKKFKTLSVAKKKFDYLRVRHSSDISISIKRYETVDGKIETSDV